MAATPRCPDCPDHSRGKVNKSRDGVVRALQSGQGRQVGSWPGKYTADNHLCRELSEREVYVGLHQGYGVLAVLFGSYRTHCFPVRCPPWLSWSNAHMPSLKTTVPSPWYRNPRMQRDARWTGRQSVPWTVQSKAGQAQRARAQKYLFLEKVQAVAVARGWRLACRERKVQVTSTSRLFAPCLARWVPK